MTVKHHAIIIPDRSSPSIVSLSSTTLNVDGTETANTSTGDDETGSGRAGIVSFDPPGGDMQPQLVGGDARAEGRIGVLTPGTLDSARWSVTHSEDGAWWARTSPQVFNRPFVAMRHWTPTKSRNMGEVRDVTTSGMAYVQRVRMASNGETVLCAQGYGERPREREQRIQGLAIQVGPESDWPITYQSEQNTGWWTRETLWTMIDFDICGDPDTLEWVFVGVYARGVSGRKMVIARSRDGAEWVTVGEFSVGYEPEEIPTGDISLPGGDNSLFTSCAVAKSTGRSLAILVGTQQGVYALYSRDGGRTVQVNGEVSDQNADFSTLSITTLRDGSFWATYAFAWSFEGSTRSNIYSMYSRAGDGWVLNGAVGFDAWEAPKSWTCCPVQRPDGHGQIYTAGRSWLLDYGVKRAIVATRSFIDADIYTDSEGGFREIDLGSTEPGGVVLQMHPIYGCDEVSTWVKGDAGGVASYHIGPVDVAAVEHRGKLIIAVGTNVEYESGGRQNDGGATIIYESNRWSPVTSARGLTWDDEWFFGVDTTYGRPYHIHWSPAAEPQSETNGWTRVLAAGGSANLDADLELDQGVYYERPSIPNYNGGDADNANSHESERSFLLEAELRVIDGGSTDFNRIAISIQMVDDDGFTSALVVRFERENSTSVKVRAIHPDGLSDSTLTARDDQWITVWAGHEEKGGYYTVYAQVEDEEAVEVLSVSGVVSPGGVDPADEHIRWGHISAHVDSQSAWRLFQIQRATGAARDAKGSPMPPFRLLTEDDFDSTAGGVTPPLTEDTVTGVIEQIAADSGIFNYDMPCRTRAWAIDADVISASWRGISTSIGSWSWTCEQQSGIEAAVGSPIRPGRHTADRVWTTTAETRHGSRVLTLDVDGIRFDSIAVFRRNWPACTIEAYHPDLGEWIGIDVGPSEAGVGVELRDTSLWRATGGNSGFRGEAAEYGFDLVHASLTTDGPLPIGRLEPDIDRGIRYYATGIYPMGSDDRMHVWAVRGNSTRTIFTNASPLGVASFWNLGATWSELLDVRQSLAIYSDRFALDLSPIVSPHIADQTYLSRPTQLRITIHPHVRGDGDGVETGSIVLGQMFDLTRPGFGTSVDQSWQTGAVHSAGQRGIVRAEREHPILRSWAVACQYLPPVTRPDHEDGIATNSAECIEALIGALRLGAGREIVWVPDSDLLTPNDLGNEGDPGTVTPLIAGGPTSAAWRELALARLSPSVDVGTTIMQGVPDAAGACRGLPVHSTRFKVEEV